MTYKTRLFVYVGMLIVLLAGMMTLSFKTARDVILAGTEEHLRNGALLKQDSVRAQRQELLHYIEIISRDQRLQEYLYIIVELGTSPEGLEAYYNRQFAVLPTDYRDYEEARDRPAARGEASPSRTPKPRRRRYNEE